MRLQLTTILLAVACSSVKATDGACPDGEVRNNGVCEAVEDSEPGLDTGEPEPDTSEPEDTAVEPCRIELESMTPRDEDEEVYWKDPIIAQLEAADPSATISVVDAAGAVIEGEVINADGGVRFVATSGLTPSAQHTATLDWCHGTEVVSFTTSDLGLPLEAEFWGQGFSLDLGMAQWVQPDGMGIVMGDMLDIVMLVGMSEFDLGIDVWSAISLEDSMEQDLCESTFDLQQSDPELLPYFEFGPGGMEMSLFGSDFEMLGFTGSGTISPDASVLGGIEVEFMMDIRNITGDFADMMSEAFGGMDLSDHETFCGGLDLMGDGCEPCPTEEAEPFCMRIKMDKITAVSTDQTIVQVEEDHCHPECPTRDEYPECE